VGLQHHQVVRPGLLQHVGHQLGGDRGPQAGLLVTLERHTVTADQGCIFGYLHSTSPFSARTIPTYRSLQLAARGGRGGGGLYTVPFSDGRNFFLYRYSDQKYMQIHFFRPFAHIFYVLVFPLTTFPLLLLLSSVFVSIQVLYDEVRYGTVHKMIISLEPCSFQLPIFCVGEGEEGAPCTLFYNSNSIHVYGDGVFQVLGPSRLL
jgi:hypothetical protein